MYKEGCCWLSAHCLTFVLISTELCACVINKWWYSVKSAWWNSSVKVALVCSISETFCLGVQGSNDVGAWQCDSCGRDRCCRARLRGGPVGQLPGVLTYKAHWDVTGIIRNMVLVNSDFHMQKKSSKIIHILGTHPQKFNQPYSRPEKFKEYWC